MDLSSLASGGAQGSAADGLIKDTTTRDFMADVVEASRAQPVIVDFWAPWCGPCKQLTPVLEKLVRAAKGAVKLVKMNIDEHPAVAQQMGVQSIPAVFAFVDGRPADGFMGALPESQVKAFIDRLAGPAGDGREEVLASASAAFEEGDVAGAAEIYAAVLQEDRENLTAIGGLARCLVASGELDRAKAAMVSAESAYEAAKSGTTHAAQLQAYRRITAPFDGIVAQNRSDVIFDRLPGGGFASAHHVGDQLAC